MMVRIAQDRGGDGWIVLPRMYLADECALIVSVDYYFLTREHLAPIEDEL